MCISCLLRSLDVIYGCCSPERASVSRVPLIETHWNEVFGSPNAADSLSLTTTATTSRLILRMASRWGIRARCRTLVLVTRFCHLMSKTRLRQQRWELFFSWPVYAVQDALPLSKVLRTEAWLTNSFGVLHYQALEFGHGTPINEQMKKMVFAMWECWNLKFKKYL